MFLLLRLVILIAVCVLTYYGVEHYPGKAQYYLFFSVVFNGYLFFAIRSSAYFIETFLAAYLWLGFWLKFTIRQIYMDGKFYVDTGVFDFALDSLDWTLVLAGLAMLSLFLASILIRALVKEKYGKLLLDKDSYSGLIYFYTAHRTVVLISFFVFILIVCLINYHFGIYQRGGIPEINLPYGLSGIMTWLITFGMTSISAVILFCEFQSKKMLLAPSFLLLFELFASNISLLSRGMILNGAAVMYGYYQGLKNYAALNSNRIHFLICLFMLFGLFIASVHIVNVLRMKNIYETMVERPGITQSEKNVLKKKLGDKLDVKAVQASKILFLDRWIGIESLMAVSASEKKGWLLWERAWAEKFDYNSTSLFDKELIDSPYLKRKIINTHYISLPGLIAFLFYPGKVWFLISSLFFIGMILIFFERLIFSVSGGNYLLTALMMQVLANRFAHFGYVPSQSYLLFGAIFLNLVIIYFVVVSLQYAYKSS